MTTTFVRRLASVAAVSSLFISGFAFAQATGGAVDPNPPQAKKAPEQAAIDACKDKKEGDKSAAFKDAKGKTRTHYRCATVDGVLAARSGVASGAKKTKAEKAQ